MRVIFTEPALADVEDIREYLSAHYPFTMPSVERRIQVVLNHIASWPKSGRPVVERPGVRVVPLLRYPYRIFYRVTPDAVEILHIHHSARNS